MLASTSGLYGPKIQLLLLRGAFKPKELGSRGLGDHSSRALGTPTMAIEGQSNSWALNLLPAPPPLWPMPSPCLLVPGWPLEHAAALGTLPAEGGIWAETCLPACVPTSPPSFPSPTEHLWPLLPSGGCSLGGRLPTHRLPSPASAGGGRQGPDWI